MMLAMFDAKKCLVGNADLLGKFRIGKIASFFSQEFSQLPVKIALHKPEGDKNIITYA